VVSARVWIKIFTQVSAVKEEYQEKVDSLLAKFARDHSQLEVTRLHSQLKAREVRGHFVRNLLLFPVSGNLFCFVYLHFVVVAAANIAQIPWSKVIGQRWLTRVQGAI